MSSPVGTETQSPSRQFERVQALDAFRGVLVFVFSFSMLAIPAIAALPATSVGEFLRDQLRPTVDVGVCTYDLILPGFLFVAGISIVLSHNLRRNGSASRSQLAGRVAIRGMTLYAVGYLLQAMWARNWSDIELLGPLQRLAICYLVASLLEILTQGWVPPLVATLAILPSYWTLGETLSLDAAASLWQVGGTSSAWLQFATTIPAIALTTSGVAAGRYLVDYRNDPLKVLLTFYVVGLLCLDLSVLWDAFSAYRPSEWSPSFVLASIGCLQMIFAGLLFFEESEPSALLKPFVALGRNSLVIVAIVSALPLAALSGLLVRGELARYLDNVAPFARTALCLMLIYLLAAWLFRRRIFITL